MCRGDAIVLKARRVGCGTSVEQCTFDTATIIGAQEMQLSWRLEEWGALRQESSAPIRYCYHFNRCGVDANVLEASKVGCNTSVGKCTFNTATIIGAEEMQLCWRLY